MRNTQRRRGVMVAVLGLWASLWTVAARGAIFVERLDPPSLTRGTTIRLTATGSELGGATGLWTSLAAGKVEATLVEPSRDDRAVFEVKVSSDAPLGLYGLRVATRSGLSNAKLFLIDDLPTVAEQDAAPKAGQRLRWPAAVQARAREAELDRYTFDVESGQRLTFEVVGSRLGQDYDPVVTIKDAGGRVLVERDNDVGLLYDCRFGHAFAKAGTYTIEVNDTRFRGSDHMAYVLRVGRFPEGRVAYPSAIRAGERLAIQLSGDEPFTQDVEVPTGTAPGVFFQALRREDDQGSAWVPLEVSPFPNALEREPNDRPEDATPAPTPSVLHGAITSPDDQDSFALDLAAGQRLSALVECRPLGSPADLDVALIDPNGRTLARLDTLPDGAAPLEIAAPSKGRHVLRVRSLTGEAGPGFVYRIRLAPREPAVQLVSDASMLAIPRGSYQPLPLAVTRTDFAGPVALELRGQPPGMTLRTAVVAEGEAVVDSAIEVADSVPEGLYSVQVVGRIQAGGIERTAVATTLPLVDRPPTGRGPHGEPFDLREDQRKLPPTLTDRVAILVTGSSPFTFELPDRLVVLPRYLSVEFPVEITRIVGFASPITFEARGGSLDPLNLQKPRIRSEIPAATAEHRSVKGLFRSGVNSELRKQRVTVTAHATHDGRAIDLTRTFQLHTRPAYEPVADPPRLEVEAGASATVAVRANRIRPFDGPIVLRPSGVAGWDLPSELAIAAGADQAELKIAVPPKTKPGTYRIALSASAHVAKFDEAVKGKPVEVVVVAPKGGPS